MAQYSYTALEALLQNGLPGVQACYDQASSCFVSAAYFDSDGNPFVPAAASYRVDDVTSGEPIVPWTSLNENNTAGGNWTAGSDVTAGSGAPTSTNLISITSVQNAMISVTRPFEVHQLTVQVTDSAGNQFYENVKFLIRRIFGPVPDTSAGGDWTAGSEVSAGI